MSNFKKVIDFNEAFGVTVNSTPHQTVFEDDKSLVKLRLSLINEEVKELNEAVDNKDFVETIDALADILYVVYGAGASFGIDLDKAFNIVHDSNMSKLCKTEEEAKETVEWYVKNDPRYDSPAYRKGLTGDYWVVYNKSSGKILKSVNYTAADFKNMLTNLN